MTVTGAARIFGALAGEASVASLLFASALLTQTKRAGQQFAEEGSSVTRSYSSRNCCSVTGRSVHALRVQAERNNRSRPTLSSLSDMCHPRGPYNTNLRLHRLKFLHGAEHSKKPSRGGIDWWLSLRGGGRP